MLLERINVGGMAEVFRAKSFGVEGFERIVAVKRILPQMAEDADFIRMFIDEARIASQLTHHNIVQIYELGKEDDVYFIAMEFVTGRDLRLLLDRLKRHNRRMPEPMACFIISLVCEALDYAHRKKSPAGQPYKIIHRDVSPQNVLISYEGEVKLCDFGIAKAVNQSQRTQAGVLKGKFAYMSPEQVKGQKIDHRSDLFALGVIFYEMLTGQRLFLGESDFSTLEAVRSARVPNPRTYNRNLPPRLEKILMKMLARLPKDRYQNASQIFNDLQEYLVGSRQLFHAHHLRQFMQTQYAKEIDAENTKLKGFLETKPPQSPRRAPSREPREVAVVRSLRDETASDFDSVETGDINVSNLGVQELLDSGPATDDIPELSQNEFVESSIQTDEYDELQSGDDSTQFEKPLTEIAKESQDDTASLPLPDFREDAANVTVHGSEEYSFGENSEDGDRTICDDGSDGSDGTEGSNLAAEIHAAQAELLEHMQGNGDQTADSQVTEYKGKLLPDAVISPSEEQSDHFGHKDEIATNTTGAAPSFEAEYTDIETGVSILSDDNLTADQTNAGIDFKPIVQEGYVTANETLSSFDGPGIVTGTMAPVEGEDSEPTTGPSQVDNFLNARSYSGSGTTPRPPDPSRNASHAHSGNPELSTTAAVSLRDPKVLMAAAAIVATMVVFLLVLLLGTGNKPSASLTINSVPINKVDIYVDGELIGDETPHTLKHIARGTHEIKLEAKGFRVYRQSFEIQESRPHTLSIPLIKQPAPKAEVKPKPLNPPADAGVSIDASIVKIVAPAPEIKLVPNWNLHVVSIPRGASVSFDRESAGKAPLYQRSISPDRSVDVVMELEGYLTYKETVRPPSKAGSTVRLRGILKPLAPKPPQLKADTKSKVLSKSQALRTPPPPKPKPAVAQRAKRQRPPPPKADKNGYLMITTIPKGLDIIIDGTPTGLKSPFRKPHSLTPGKHTVEIVSRTGKKHSFKVLISSGGTTKLVKRIR